jgi:hypothetical protein
MHMFKLPLKSLLAAGTGLTTLLRYMLGCYCILRKGPLLSRLYGGHCWSTSIHRVPTALSAPWGSLYISSTAHHQRPDLDTPTEGS